MTINKIPLRSEIDDTYKWCLNDIISSLETFENIYNSCLENLKEIALFKDHLTKNASDLLRCLQLKDTLLMDLETLYVYSNMTLHEDTTNNHSQVLSERASNLQSIITQGLSFIEPELIELTSEKISALTKEEPSLKTYEHYLNNLLRKKEHILSKELEALLSKATDFSTSIQTIFSMFNEADIKFPEIIGEEGNPVELTKGRFISFMESKDRRVRKDAFEALLSTYNNHRNTLAAIYTSSVKKHVFYKNARRFSSSLEASLYENNISTEVYTQLISTVNDYLPTMHRYVDLRKRVLKLEDIHFYDLYTPMIKDVRTTISYSDAKNTVKDALMPLGQDYIDLLDIAFDNRWIDVYENKGKRSGAYSWGTYNSHPYVLLNFDDSIKNMFTLAHEMGHALHSYLSNKNQAYVNSHYSIFLAEVASTVNEALLMQYLLAKTEDPSTKLYLLNYYMEQFRGTVFRQTMFAEFEKITHEIVENGDPLTSEKLCEIYYDLNIKYYGPQLNTDRLIEIEWARIPHFYYNFYVFQYATGYSAAIALSKKILTEGASAVNAYLEFLKSGGSDYSLEILKKAGVDMTSSIPITSALDEFEKIVSEMECYEKNSQI
ncbi:oligopeptidase F [Natranaerovirga pectinivora]|uniref:Oligopeptidase F n=1 Tax=Natranaerovirga pectinivora TaxID=682400 RepID=A0A4R3MF43_9FIRM|nr:oligoendopeptidase F [Natranaerovirga pectinivora]TCT12307.1 oligopeptidase F [Natranaerovirga pectinivora]